MSRTNKKQFAQIEFYLVTQITRFPAQIADRVTQIINFLSQIIYLFEIKRSLLTQN